SLATITASRPSMRPMPVMMPAQGASPSYMPKAASCESSRNGDPGSRRARTRSRGGSFPRAACFFCACSPPPSATRATWERRSSASARWCAAFAWNAGPEGSSRDFMRGTLLAEVARDQHALDFARALVDLGDARVAVVPLHGVIVQVAVAAVDLDRLRADPFGELRGVEL